MLTASEMWNFLMDCSYVQKLEVLLSIKGDVLIYL